MTKTQDTNVVVHNPRDIKSNESHDNENKACDFKQDSKATSDNHNIEKLADKEYTDTSIQTCVELLKDISSIEHLKTETKTESVEKINHETQTLDKEFIDKHTQIFIELNHTAIQTDDKGVIDANDKEIQVDIENPTRSNKDTLDEEIQTFNEVEDTAVQTDMLEHIHQRSLIIVEDNLSDEDSDTDTLTMCDDIDYDSDVLLSELSTDVE